MPRRKATTTKIKRKPRTCRSKRTRRTTRGVYEPPVNDYYDSTPELDEWLDELERGLIGIRIWQRLQHPRLLNTIRRRLQMRIAEREDLQNEPNGTRTKQLDRMITHLRQWLNSLGRIIN